MPVPILFISFSDIIERFSESRIRISKTSSQIAISLSQLPFLCATVVGIAGCYPSGVLNTERKLGPEPLMLWAVKVIQNTYWQPVIP